MRPSLRSLALAFAVSLAACSSPEPAQDTQSASNQVEGTSLLGTELVRRSFTPEQRTQLDAELAEAQAAYERAPLDADSIIWYGRRLAYLERYRDAVEVFTEGVEKHPDDPRMYRHRGHRYITLRMFDDALADFQYAARLIEGTGNEIEPDGRPNARNIPLSTLHGNVYYHLALTHYLRGEYDESLDAWNKALGAATNDDSRVAVNDWRYMTLRRLGRDDEAQAIANGVSESLDIIENTAYYRRLLMYKGVVQPEELLDRNEVDDLQFATQGYGVGNWYLENGEEERGREIFRRIVESPYWAAFGYIAAEADLARAGS